MSGYPGQFPVTFGTVSSCIVYLSANLNRMAFKANTHLRLKAYAAVQYIKRTKKLKK